MKKRTASLVVPPCPCGSGLDLAACCGRYHGGEAAADAEALMRSRYAAYVLGNETYLLATWHPSTRPVGLELDRDGKTKWLGLDVRRHSTTSAHEATVEFVARYKVGGRASRMHETSRFVREDERWYYVAGELHEPLTQEYST